MVQMLRLAPPQEEQLLLVRKKHLRNLRELYNDRQRMNLQVRSPGLHPAPPWCCAVPEPELASLQAFMEDPWSCRLPALSLGWKLAGLRAFAQELSNDWRRVGVNCAAGNVADAAQECVTAPAR